ncbi:type IV pilus secretin family protein [Vulgatibacter incomptus]|uniref:Type IV pilus biogenesis protein PilQ n=1 Tax=Vulgatibacter incomptus TaxID=1391653 RepID=A0A0K1P9Z3_9BACT|nr:type IV pilus secretin family protein [Vulgatibacter incomptus]AKU90322.1 Type IV pilus biogenesis protein PilQ [Vulgatibacter incomptus]
MSQVFNRVVGAIALAAALGFSAGAGAGEGEPVAGTNVVTARVDEAKVRNPARRIVDAKVASGADGTRVELVADGAVGTYELLELENPPRLAIDLPGVSRGPKAAKHVGSRELTGIRYGGHDGKVRVVFDAASASMPAYRIDRTGSGLAIVMGEALVAKSGKAVGGSIAAASAPTKASGAGEARMDATAAAPAAPAKAPVALAEAPAAPAVPSAAQARLAAPAVRVTDVAFKGDGPSQQVQVDLSGAGAYDVSRPDPSTLVLTIPGATLPARLVRSLDTSAFEGPVRTVSSFADESEGAVRVVVALARPAADELKRNGNRLSWTFRGEDLAEGEILDEAVGTVRVAPDGGAAPRGGKQPTYTGRRVSFEFKDIDIHNLLRVIAEVSKRNIVVADDVKGTITIRLRNVPWDQALDLIMKTKGLGKEVTGNIIRIAPLQQIQHEQELVAKAQLAREDAQPLKVRIIPVNYALAKDMVIKTKSLLTKRGTVTVDQRTNTLIVKDIPDALARVESLIRSLDTQTPQVLISARIVEASSNFKRDIGIQWGGHLTANAAAGNSTGLAFPNNAAGAGSIPGAVGAGGAIPGAPNWAVSFPAAVADTAGGAVGFSFGSAGGAALLNLRLTALETQGVLKTVSAPKVTTLDNKEAVIGQGVSIPFSQVSAAGVNTVFVEAKLELKVTPHVTSDGSILMKIRASNNQPSENLTGANGQPSITKREAETEVLVKDGDTTVIGGIFTRRTAEQVAQVPLFGDIPILGWLFKSRTNSDDRTELLIFVSPTIVNRDASVVAGG